MDIASWMVIAATVWALASISVAIVVGRIIDRADDRARAESVVVPAEWANDLVDRQ